MRDWLWRAAIVFAALQAGLFMLLLLWPAGYGFHVVIARLQVWQGSRMVLMQALIGQPALIALIWGAREGAVRWLLLPAFLGTGAIFGMVMHELGLLDILATGARDSTAFLPRFTFLRWAECILGWSVLATTRLSWQREALAGA
ncbi:hypothetical protein RYZ20_10425 [Thioclava sp. A2]|uniref:hypothetical protein n=1 Tax=Thioclava sp. FCG-A2 TaxID=3080562 RepID=UPI0029547694|nr:hypothetical protein [Thioclava sp. A2]MDV7271317.1 hypothetical protein [Thioclava sp. A2]